MPTADDFSLEPENKTLNPNKSSKKGFTNAVDSGTIKTAFKPNQRLITVDAAYLGTEEWKNTYRAYCKANKPPYSRDIEKWAKKSGDLHIDEVNNIWTYGINIDGTRYEVSYINGEADFTPYMKAYVEGPEFTGDRRADRKIAEQLLWENEGITPPEGYECHHTLDGKQIQWIPKEVHKMFTHGGAVSEMKHRMSQLVKNERKQQRG